MNERAERINGLAAMLGIIAAMGAYAVTGQIIPGIWWCVENNILSSRIIKKMLNYLQMSN